MKKLTIVLASSLLLFACKKEDPDTTNNGNTGSTGPNIIFKFQFDSSQERLDNFGNPATIPSGNAAISPTFNSISGHFIELSPTELTPYMEGEQIYKGAETNVGGDLAIDFDQARIVAAGEEFVSVPISSLTPGTYEYMRVSLSYQNFQIPFRALSQDLEGTIASFLGYNQYITSHTIRNKSETLNTDTTQGYWAFETHDEGLPVDVDVVSGHAQGTTVVNPINSTSPIPVGSCVVTGEFANGGFVITGDETEDIIVVISLSTNQSFEWTEDEEVNGIYDAGETVVDMGIRGLIPIVQ